MLIEDIAAMACKPFAIGGSLPELDLGWQGDTITAMMGATTFAFFSEKLC